MKNKELLLEAIDNCDYFTARYRKLLKSIVELARDGVVNISLLQLSKLSKVSRPTIHNAIHFFEDQGLIERVKHTTKKTSALTLKENKLGELIKDYEARERLRKKYS